MRKFKILFIAVFMLLVLGGIHIGAGSCSATATCGASCSITGPAGGSVQCTGMARKADCKAFDANGNLCNNTGCQCSPFFACYQILNPTC